MKKLLFSLLFIFSLKIVFAQSTLMATLDHNGEITHCYGSHALVDAMKLAADGDIITLSSGAFVATNISKTITLRGAGMDSEYGEPTIIKSGSLYIQATDTTKVLTIEDIQIIGSVIFNGKNKDSRLRKCRFNSLNGSSNNINGLTVENCVIKSLTMSGTGIKILNSVMSNVGISGTTGAQFINCILQGSMSNLDYCELCNSILVANSNNYALPSSSIATNCIGYGRNSFVNIPNSTNWHIDPSTTNIFANESQNSNSTLFNFTSFELTEEVMSAYLGTDGTEVGVYGGFLPYTSKPTNPKITKCNVAKKTTADGKLSVEIEVSAQE